MRARAFAVLLGALAPAAARADTLQDVPVGGRTAAMGGVGIARGDDSAMPLLNPAGMVLVPRTTLSISASLYGVSVASVPSFNSDADTTGSDLFGDLNVSQRGVRSSVVQAFPSAVSAVFHLGDERQIVGLSILVPTTTDRRYLQNVDLANDRFVLRNQMSFTEQTGRITLAPSYAVGLSDRFRLGASVLLAYSPSTVSASLTMLTVSGQGTDFWRRVSQVTAKGHSFDLGATIGMQWDASDSFALGLAVQTPSAHLGGTWEGDDEYTALASDGSAIVRRTLTTGDLTLAPPFRIGAGIAWRFGERSMIALDGNLYLAGKGDHAMVGDSVVSTVNSGQPPSISGTSFDLQYEGKTAINVGLGVELGVGDAVTLRGGLFTNFATAKAPPDDPARLTKLDLLKTPVDRYGFALGLGYLVGPVDSTVGVSASFGSGTTVRQSPAYASELLSTTGVSTYDVFAFVTGTLDVAETRKALESP